MISKDPHFKKQHPDLYNSEIALKRAASKVWEKAKRTGSAVIYSKNGKLVKEYPSEKDGTK